MDKDIKTQLDTITKNIEILTLQITQLTVAVNQLSTVCGRMDNHINLVENVYSIVRTPMTYVTDKVNNFMGNKDIRALPSIEYKEIE